MRDSGKLFWRDSLQTVWPHLPQQAEKAIHPDQVKTDQDLLRKTALSVINEIRKTIGTDPLTAETLNLIGTQPPRPWHAPTTAPAT